LFVVKAGRQYGAVKTLVGGPLWPPFVEFNARAATECRPYNNAREDMEMEQCRNTVSKYTCDRRLYNALISAV